MSCYRADALASILTQPVPARIRVAFAAALRGSTADATALAGTTATRTLVALLPIAHAARMPAEAFRALLATSWQRDHLAVVIAAANRRRLRGWFRHAAFRLPAGTPARLRVWSHGPSYRAAAEAYVWSVGRPDLAAGPVVVTAMIERSAVALRDGQRVVVLRAPLGVLAVQK